MCTWWGDVDNYQRTVWNPPRSRRTPEWRAPAWLPNPFAARRERANPPPRCNVRSRRRRRDRGWRRVAAAAAFYPATPYRRPAARSPGPDDTRTDSSRPGPSSSSTIGSPTTTLRGTIARPSRTRTRRTRRTSRPRRRRNCCRANWWCASRFCRTRTWRLACWGMRSAWRMDRVLISAGWRGCRRLEWWCQCGDVWHRSCQSARECGSDHWPRQWSYQWDQMEHHGSWWGWK